jgi:CHAT domain
VVRGNSEGDATTMNLQLDVQRDHQLCSFRLSWGQEQRLSATLPYPASLTAQYQAWCEAYLSFYRKLASGELLEEEPSPAELRGRIEESGSLSSAEDWRFQLVQVEAHLLAEFHRWLYSAQLIEIRQQIVWVARDYWEQAPTIAGASNGVNLFLTCSPIELERLPWEAWEIGTEFATTGSIRIIRTPLNMPMKPGSRGGKRRNTGLDFQADRTAVRSLRRLADVQFVGWQPEQTTCQVITQIKAAIADERGWDMLFFAGHSNETKMTGGELGIAPGVSIAIHEIESQLLIAKELGLQVAIFNSCRGLSIAEALIRLGFGQVVVMREPIHNRVAQEFLLQLLQGLVQHRDVHDSLIAARQFLRLEKNHTYPSAYLVPSLFCHPGATLYQIAPLRWQQRLLNSLPTRWEAIASGAAKPNEPESIQGWVEARNPTSLELSEGDRYTTVSGSTPNSLSLAASRSFASLGVNVAKSDDRGLISLGG